MTDDTGDSRLTQTLNVTAEHIERAKTIAALKLSQPDEIRLVLIEATAAATEIDALRRRLVADGQVAGLSVRQLADAAGIATNTISRWTSPPENR